jgi:hypothetical protein
VYLHFRLLACVYALKKILLRPYSVGVPPISSGVPNIFFLSTYPIPQVTIIAASSLPLASYSRHLDRFAFFGTNSNRLRKSSLEKDRTMPPTTTIFRAARPIFQQTSRAAFRSQFARTSGRRFQSTATGSEGPSAQQQQGWFKRMWDSPIGFKTVHFW